VSALSEVMQLRIIRKNFIDREQFRGQIIIAYHSQYQLGRIEAMYDFIDQEVTRLNPGGKFLVWSIRNWVQAVENKRCPPHAIAPAFAKYRIISALPHFHTMMIILNKEGLEKIFVSPVRCQNLSDDEAMILSLFHALCYDRGEQVGKTVEMLVTEGYVGQLFAALTAIALRLVENDLAPAIPTHAQETAHTKEK
jgi:hypothetical protein